MRFKNPVDGEVVVEDLIRGNIVFQNAELDDLIIARADGTPTYNFCVVVDDMDMGITMSFAATTTSTTRLGKSTFSKPWAYRPHGTLMYR